MNADSCPKSEINFFSTNCRHFVTLEFSPAEEIVTFRRNYSKFFELLGEIGGILKIGSILMVFYLLYNAKARESMLASKVFGFHKEKRQKTSKVADFGLEAKKSQESWAARMVSKEELKMIALECVRDTTSSLNLLDKLCFVEVLQDLILDATPSEDLIDLTTLKLRIEQKELSFAQEKTKMKENENLSTLKNPKEQKTDLEREIKSILENYLNKNGTRIREDQKAEIRKIPIPITKNIIQPEIDIIVEEPELSDSEEEKVEETPRETEESRRNLIQNVRNFKKRDDDNMLDSPRRRRMRLSRRSRRFKRGSNPSTLRLMKIRQRSVSKERFKRRL